MDETPRSPGSHLFTVRLWAEAPRAGQLEWRGKLQHVLSGEVRYFRDWPTLIAQLEELIAAACGPDADARADPQQ